MPSAPDTMLAIPQALFAEVETLARQLNIEPSQFIVAAIELHMQRVQNVAVQPANEMHAAPRILKKASQGDIFWVTFHAPDTPAAGIPHPHVIIQDDLLNHSRIETVIGCALTSNLHRASETPGNLLLDAGEANLPRQSVVEVSKITTIHKSQLGEHIGSLSRTRVNQILAGLRFLQASYFSR